MEVLRDQGAIEAIGRADCDGKISADHENVAGKAREQLAQPRRSDLVGRVGQHRQ